MVTFIRKKHILAGKTDEEEVKECIENGMLSNGKTFLRCKLACLVKVELRSPLPS